MKDFYEGKTRRDRSPIELLLRRDLVPIVNLFTGRQGFFSLTAQSRQAGQPLADYPFELRAEYFGCSS